MSAAATAASLVSAAEEGTIDGKRLLLPESYDIFWSTIVVLLIAVLVVPDRVRPGDECDQVGRHDLAGREAVHDRAGLAVAG